MAPKKNVPAKKVAGEEEKKKIATGISARDFFGPKSAAPASDQQKAGGIAPSSSTAPPPPSVKPKSMSGSEAMSLLLESSESEMELSQTQHESSQEETSQQDTQQQAVLPDVGAEQDVELSSSSEEGDVAVPTMGRKRKGTSSSSPSPPSDDLDKNWIPEDSETRHGRQGKRKVSISESLGSAEGAGDDNPVIVSVETRSEDIQIIEPAPVKVVPPTPPASIFRKPLRPAVATTPTTVAVRATVTSQTPPPSLTSSSSGFGTIRKLSSPVWDFFTLSPEQENIAVCSICHKKVSRGKAGTHLGTGGQSSHLKKHHAIRWAEHLKKISDGSGQAAELIEEGGDEEEESNSSQSSTATTPKSLSHAPSPAATSAWHQAQGIALTTTPKRPTSLPAAGTHRSHVAVVPQAKQPTITAMFSHESPYHRNHKLVRLYNGKLAKMLALDLLPFSFVEGEGFLELVEALCPKWKVPSRTYFATVAVPRLHHDVLQLIGQAMQQSTVHSIHLTTDMWTSCQATDYMCITSHWISFDGVKKRLADGLSPADSFLGVRKHATVAMFAMEKSHTAANILDEFNTKVYEWLRPRGLRIGFVATDNGSNIVKAMNDGGYFRVLCLAHCINLVVQDFIKKEEKVQDVVSTCRRICTHFSHSFKARKELRTLLRANKLPVKALIQEVPTRWNSTYYMLQRLFEQYKAINEYVMRRGGEAAKPMTMDLEKWRLVNCLTEMLLPFEVITRDVSRDDSTISQAIPFMHMLQDQLRRVQQRFHESENADAASMVASLIDRVRTNVRLQNDILSSENYICATLLDPRYKKASRNVLPFTEADVSKYTTWIVNKVYDHEDERLEIHGQAPPTSSRMQQPASAPREGGSPSLQKQARPKPPSSSQASKPASTDWMKMSLGLQSSTEVEEEEEAPTILTIQKMVKDYLDDPKGIYMDQNPLLYWYGKMEMWPELSKLAIKFLACPIASVSSERVFSAAGAVVSVRRTNLSPQNVERLTMIKMNRHFIPKNYEVPESEDDDEGNWSDVVTDPPMIDPPEFEDELYFPDQ